MFIVTRRILWTVR